MRNVFFIIYLACLPALAGSAFAQQFGGNPSSLKWDQINTDTVRVIFPRGLQRQAVEVSNIVHRMAGHPDLSLGGRLQKINIVLQNQTTLSNGYVGIGPFRSEFQLTPNLNSFELGSLPWHKTLAVHEYRHVEQFNLFRTGKSRWFYYLFGQEGLGFANSMAVPNWFWEGDAVYQETRLSLQGRGRLPAFFNPFRSLWASGREYSWMKLRNGSYRDMVPNHYALGYLLIAYGTEKFGDSAWAGISRDAAAYKSIFYPFQQAFRKTTGQPFREFSKEAISFFKNASDYKNASGRAGIADTAASFARAHAHFVADEEYPQWIDSSSLVFVKSSYKQIPAFYARHITNGTERRLRVKDISPDNYFSYRNGRIAYTGYEVDTRWGWKDYGVIKVVDLHTGTQRTVTRQTKYFTPDISADGRYLVSVHANDNGTNELHLVETATGRLITRLPAPEGYLFTYPKFYPVPAGPPIDEADHDRKDISPPGMSSAHTLLQGAASVYTATRSPDMLEQQIPPQSTAPVGTPTRGAAPADTAKNSAASRVVAAVRNDRGEMALGVFDCFTGLQGWLTPFTMRVIGFPQVKGDTVSFSMSDGSRDKLFAVISGKLHEFRPSLPNPSTGNYQLSLSGKTYAWTSFTAVGYQVMTGEGRFEAVDLAGTGNTGPDGNENSGTRIAGTRVPGIGNPDTSAPRAEMPGAGSPGTGTFSTRIPEPVYPLKRLWLSPTDSNALNLMAPGNAGIRRYPVTPYRAAYRLVNIHSWRPVLSDPDYSYSLYSENILNTLQAELSGTYNRNERYKEVGASLAYGGWFPVVRGRFSYTFDRLYQDSTARIQWNELNAGLGLDIPLKFVRGAYSGSITPSASINTKQISYTKAARNEPGKQFYYSDLSLSFTRQRLRARQQIYPQFAQTLFTRYRQILDTYTGYQLLINSSVYLPGIGATHSTVLQASWQQRDTMQQYGFSNSFPFSRGYVNIDLPRMLKLGLNYHFPLVYPDWGFGNMLYILRVRANIFYDLSIARSLRTGRRYDFRTAGTEIFFDTRWWNQLPVSLGVRYSYLADAGLAGMPSPVRWELILPVGLTGR